MNSKTNECRAIVSLLSACVVIVTVTACRESAAADLSLSSAVPITTATSVGSAPMFAVAPSGKQAIAWVSAPGGGTDGRLYVSVDGKAPAEIRDTLGPIAARGESPPKIAFGPDEVLRAIYVVTKVVPGRRHPLAALRFVESSDGGSTWSPPVTVTSDGVFGSHNFHALHVAADGTTYVSWLGGGHGKSAAWISRSADNGQTWTPAARPDSGAACPCCRTSLATAGDGTLYLSWRKVFPGNVRDIVLTRSTDRGATWSAPARIHADNWVYDGCPEAGPSLKVDRNGLVHIAWWTGKEGSAGVHYAQSNDGGKTFSAPIALGTAQFSKPAHVQLAIDDAGQTIVAAWDDGTVKVPEIVLRVSRDGGRTFSERQAASEPGQAASFPVVTLVGNTLNLAWTQKTVEEAAKQEAAMPNMKDPKAVMGLEPVGAAKVFALHAQLK